MNESDHQEDRTLRKPSQAGDASTLRKPASDAQPSPKLTLEQARNQYLSLKRVLLLVVLSFVIWYVLPRPFSREIDRQQENSGSTAIEVSEELPTPIQVHLREGIIRTRGAWATHPILSVFTYVLLHGNAVSVCIAFVMLRSGTAPARDRVGSSSLMGLVSGVLLWTAFWGYDQWGWYVLVFFANGWFVSGMSRNTEFGEDRPVSSGMTRNKRSETASVSSSANVPSNVGSSSSQASEAARRQHQTKKAMESHAAIQTDQLSFSSIRTLIDGIDKQDAKTIINVFDGSTALREGEEDVMIDSVTEFIDNEHLGILFGIGKGHAIIRAAAIKALNKDQRHQISNFVQLTSAVRAAGYQTKHVQYLHFD